MDGENCQEASAVPEVQEPNVGQEEVGWQPRKKSVFKRQRCKTCGRWFRPNSGTQIRCATHYKSRIRLGPNHSSRPQARRQINCRRCGVEVISYRTNQRFCSKVCFRAQQRERSYTAAETETYGVSTTTTGAAAELLVCADLAKRGVATFRAVSPASKYDLIACSDSDGRVWRIQGKKCRRMALTLAGKERVQYQLSNYKIPAGTDVMALAALQSPMAVFYFKPINSAVYYIDTYWKFWEVN